MRVNNAPIKTPTRSAINNFGFILNSNIQILRSIVITVAINTMKQIDNIFIPNLVYNSLAVTAAIKNALVLHQYKMLTNNSLRLI